MKDRFEPNFDDERTLLAAQQVVPLEKINAKVRHRKQWFLGGAFAVAMMLGAASALLASYFKMRNVQPVPVEVTQEITPVEEPAATVAAVEEPEEAVEEPKEEVIPEESTPKKEAPVKRRTVVAAAKPNDSISEPSDTRQLGEEDQLHQIRDAVLYDEWQERRARRVWRRERRRAERYNHRDLSNLDEIFEGRRRPNP
ncbi:MAG TPA: hypothetical protein VFH96_02870 [Pyrinomonadaceae bacterium]|nr:hypothetical protein [Pyrinomonadaceae bacterium]